MFLGGVNLIPVFVSAVLYMVIGAAWYSSWAFGKSWQKMSGISESAMKEGVSQALAGSFVAALVLAYVLSWVVSGFMANSFLSGMVISFWLWLGFMATVMLNSVLYERKPISLYSINAGYLLVALLFMGGVLAAW